MARAARRPPATSTARHAAAAVLVAAAFHRLLALSVLLVAGAAQSSFDASGEQLVLLPSLAHPGGALLQPLVAAAGPLLVPLVRWDTLHYLGAASPRPLPTSSSAHLSWWGSGYAYEHTLAFQPGLPALLRWAGRLGTSGEPETWQIEQSLVITTALAVLASALAPVLLVLYVPHAPFRTQALTDDYCGQRNKQHLGTTPVRAPDRSHLNLVSFTCDLDFANA